MKIKSSTNILITSITIASACIANPAAAQIARSVAQPVLNAPRLGLVSAIQAPIVRIDAKQETIISSAQIATNGPFKAGSALSSFDLSFKNGDHKIRQISVLQKEQSAELAFADQDSNDPFFGAASWISSDSFKSMEVTAAGGGEFDIPIAPMAGYTPVIKGFSFQRKDGSDANVRSFGVRIDPAGNKIRVNLIDDQGLDMRGYERTIAAGMVMVFQPYGIIAGTSFAVGDAIKMISEHEFNNGMRQYAITVQYAWIPNSMVASSGAISGTGDNYESGQRPGGNSVIQGFLFQFMNSDHHLLASKITFGNSISSNPNIHFQDGDKDDPKQWFINYVNVK